MHDIAPDPDAPTLLVYPVGRPEHDWSGDVVDDDCGDLDEEPAGRPPDLLTRRFYADAEWADSENGGPDEPRCVRCGSLDHTVVLCDDIPF